MGSKRPEQAHKDLLSTDRKTRPNDEHIHEIDKHKVHSARGKLATPPRAENPALRDLKGRRSPRPEEP